MAMKSTKAGRRPASCSIDPRSRPHATRPAPSRAARKGGSAPQAWMSEQTIRNKRANGNPYQMLYRKWEGIAERLLATSSPKPIRMDGGIICESEIRKIENTTIRHQVLLLFGQNRSLHNQLNILKQDAGNAPIRIDGLPSISGGEDLALTPAEVDAVRDFIDPRKLRAKHLLKTEDHGVSTRDGRAIADPGFITALEKISKSYQRP